MPLCILCVWCILLSTQCARLRFCHTHTHTHTHTFVKTCEKRRDVTRHKALSQQEWRKEENGKNNSVNKISQNRKIKTKQTVFRLMTRGNEVARWEKKKGRDICCYAQCNCQNSRSSVYYSILSGSVQEPKIDSSLLLTGLIILVQY